MNIEGIQAWQPLSISLSPKLPAAPTVGLDPFQNVLMQGIQDLNNEQIAAGEQVKSFLAGEGPSLHEVMIKGEEVKTSVEFAVQLRNKIMDAYNEIMRMQV